MADPLTLSLAGVGLTGASLAVKDKKASQGLSLAGLTAGLGAIAPSLLGGGAAGAATGASAGTESTLGVAANLPKAPLPTTGMEGVLNNSLLAAHLGSSFGALNRQPPLTPPQLIPPPESVQPETEFTPTATQFADLLQPERRRIRGV